MSRTYIPGVFVQARGLRGPKGEAGDITDASSIFEATSLMSNYAGVSHIHGSVVTGLGNLSGHNITAWSASDGLTLSVAALGAAANEISTVSGGYVSLNIVGPVSTVSVTGLQPAGAYLLTAAESDHSHGNPTLNLTNISGATASASNGFTLSLTGYPATSFINVSDAVNFANSWHSHADDMSISERPNYFYTSANTFANSTHLHGAVVTGSTSNSTENTMRFNSASSGLTVIVPNYLTTAARSTHIHGAINFQTNITGSSASNGLTLSVPNLIPLANSTKFNQAWSLAGTHTAGALQSTGGSVLYLSGGDNITLSGNANTIVISGNAGGAVAGVALGNTASIPFTSGSVMFRGTNATINTSVGVGASTASQYIDVVVAAPVTGAIGALGITGSSNAFQTGSVIFEGSSNITVYTSLDGVSQYIRFSAPSIGAANNAVCTSAGGFLSCDIGGVNTSIIVTGLQATANMSNYIAVGGLSFSNANSISFGTAGAGLSTTVTAQGDFLPNAASDWYVNISNSYAHTHGTNVSFSATSNSTENVMRASSSSNGLTFVVPSFLTTAARLTHTHGSLPTIIGGIGVSSESNAWTISVPAYLVTAARETHIHGSNTFSFSNFSSSSTSSASNGLTLGLTGYPASSFVNVSQSGNIYFENGSGVSFGSGYSGLSTTITGSVNTGNIFFVNPISTGGITSGSNITFGSSVNGVNTSIFATAGGGGSGGGDSGTLSFFNTNGISFMTAGSGSTTSISASVNTNYVPLANSTKFGIFALGNTLTIPFTSGSVMLSGANLTINSSSSGASSQYQYLQISAPAIGYLFFSNNTVMSWGSVVNSNSTSFYAIAVT